MVTMAIVTPSYGPDLQSALDLHASVLRHTDDEVLHHLVVPTADVPLFRARMTPRMRIHGTNDYLPRGYVPVYGLTRQFRRWERLRVLAKVQAVHPLRPRLPMRGWMVQQIVKMATGADIEADVVVTIDSDTALIRHTSAADFMRDGVVRMYSLPAGIHAAMPDHTRWFDVAGDLLGLENPGFPQPDYISPLVAWNPDLLRGLQAHIETVSGRDWRDTIAALPTFSECVLYGRYVAEIVGGRAADFREATTKCLTYWDLSPLTTDRVDEFVNGLRGDELAIHLQSVSTTDSDVRRAAVSLAEQRLAAL